MAEPILTTHAEYRLYERGIGVHDAKMVAKNGKIISNDFSGTIKKEGVSGDGRPLVVIIKKEKNDIIIITAYYGD